MLAVLRANDPMCVYTRLLAVLRANDPMCVYTRLLAVLRANDPMCCVCVHAYARRVAHPGMWCSELRALVVSLTITHPYQYLFLAFSFTSVVFALAPFCTITTQQHLTSGRGEQVVVRNRPPF